jgi:D-alanyl-D-alanine carboxypeptidase/D-alanyl-D-alanine-endopeptidase (penicillin-binding protein 4)
MDFLYAWADSLIQKGIMKIQGALIADASEFGYNGTPNGWQESDIGNYYGAFASGLNFYDNTIKIFLKTGNVGSKAQILDIYPNVPGLSIANSVVAAKVGGDDSSISGTAFLLSRKISGRLPSNRDCFVVKGSMPDPEYLLVHELIRVLKAKGVEVMGGSKTIRLNKLTKPNYETDLKLLFQQESKTVKEIAYWTNVKSVNLFAEGLLNLLGYFSFNDGSTESGLKVVKGFWNDKINTANLVLNDGSGLSRSNAISAKHFCDLLIYMTSSPNYLDFRSTFPVAGKNGTINTLCKGGSGEGRVFAKSGTLKNIKSFAGYVDTKTGKKIAFALIVNNFKCSSYDITLKMEKVINAIAEY